MSAADMAFMNGMDANHKAGIAVAKTYLAAPAVQRRSDLTDMAQEVVKSHTAEIAKMARMRPRRGTATATK